MVRDTLFDDLPPPTESKLKHVAEQQQDDQQEGKTRPSSAPPPPAPPPKSAMKRHKEEDRPEEGTKRVRFKTSIEASVLQLMNAMRRIASHIGNPAKFSKASKLALQLVQSGSLNAETSDTFFEILRASMASPASATEPSLRQDYQSLFSAVSEKLKCFSPPQQAQLEVWLLWTQAANDFYMDDSFVFSKAASRVKQDISLLPEACGLEDASEAVQEGQLPEPSNNGSSDRDVLQCEEPGNNMIQTDELDNDPFGLNVLLSKPSRRDERASKKKEVEAAARKALEDEARLLQERREALMACLEIAAGRYRLKWAQTIIDILVKHAFDNVSKFTVQQRSAIENLWGSVREQQIRRKQGKTASGKLDVTAFEQLQKKYSQAKISIRHSVGADGDRSAEQWLG